MSRIYYDDEGTEFSAARWEHNSRTTIASVRGQAALKDLRTALLAMPQKALVKDTFCKVNEEDGTVLTCVLGAYALHKGLPSSKLNWEGAGANEIADWATRALGLRFTLAWNLIDLNDEQTYSLKPEQRWQWFIDWLNNNIVEPKAV